MRLAIALAILPVALTAQIPEEKAASLTRLVHELREKEKIPGLSAAFISGDSAPFTAVSGWADVENEVPVTPRSMFRLASISKPFTAATSLRLVEMGKLDLDVPIQTYVKSFPDKGVRLTLRQLLGNVGGIRHYREDGSDYNWTKHYSTVTEALEVFKDDPLLQPPGVKYFYSTYGFNLAGAAIEGATGLHYEDVVRELILNPSGITLMRSDDHFAIVPGRVRGYRMTREGLLQNCSLADTSVKIPGGGWTATATDVAEFGRALVNGRILTAPSFEMMSTRQTLADGSKTGYGLGLGINSEKTPRRYSHSGGQQGATTYLLFGPDERVSVAVLANLEGVNIRAIAERLYEEWTKQ